MKLVYLPSIFTGDFTQKFYRSIVTLGTRGTVVEDVVGVERVVLRVTRVDSVLAVVE